MSAIAAKAARLSFAAFCPESARSNLMPSTLLSGAAKRRRIAVTTYGQWFTGTRSVAFSLVSIPSHRCPSRIGAASVVIESEAHLSNKTTHKLTPVVVSLSGAADQASSRRGRLRPPIRPDFRTRTNLDVGPSRRRDFATTSRRQDLTRDHLNNMYLPSSDPPPLNETQVPMISPGLRRQLFPPSTSSFAPPPPTHEAIGISLKHLQVSGLLGGKSGADSKPVPPAIDFELPQLQGPTLSHHFHTLGRDVAEPYLSITRQFAEFAPPPMPEKDRWIRMSGWTRYSADGSWESVPYPSEDSRAMVFDVETLPFQGSHFPIMAVALGIDGWYSWCSPWLAGDDESPNHLIPFSPPSTSSTPTASAGTAFLDSRSELFERSTSKPRVLIGHNVLFDRARVSSEYALRRPSTRFIDTLSLHVAVSGLTSPQRPAYIAHRKKVALDASKASKTSDKGSAPAEKKDTVAKTWKDVGSLNSLAEVARLHCGDVIDKSLRDVLIDPSTTISDIRHDFEQMMTYCAVDVLTTANVFRALLPKFLATCPHPASFAGVLLMSQPVLPVDHHWPEYLERAETTYRARLEGVQTALKSLAEDARSKLNQVGENGRFVWEDDFWLRQLDWSPKRARRLSSEAPAGKPSDQSTRATDTFIGKAQEEATSTERSTPRWYAEMGSAIAQISTQSVLGALLFRATWRTHPVVFSHSHGWLFAVTDSVKDFTPLPHEDPVPLEKLGNKDKRVRDTLKGIKLYTVPSAGSGKRCITLLGRGSAKRIADGLLQSDYAEMAQGAAIGKDGEAGTKYQHVAKKLRQLADEARNAAALDIQQNIWLQQLDWDSTSIGAGNVAVEQSREEVSDIVKSPETDGSLVWPRWYWDLDVPGGGLDVSVRKRAVPLLLRLRWRGFPIVYSREHGWIYRVPEDEVDSFVASDPSLRRLNFDTLDDHDLADDSSAAYFRMPHPDGEGHKVGSPLSKAFLSAFEEGVLTSEYPAAKDALALNASCSYWTSSRERIMDQMVIWEGDAKKSAPTSKKDSTQGLILPQVIPMGTVTRRAVEKTWLTASNAKKNRVGSELKAMVRAPPGYAIVGADVDSEELWVCSVMGDAQFGIHGATAIGWMTLEGTKSAGTDLHSKTASILGISRDAAKVFNYSRIYGAGVKHAVTLLLKSNPTLSVEQATTLAKELYVQTKGVVDRSDAFGRPFWHGGTESFVFNKLEEIARSERPRTPALGCGLTDALKKCFLPAEGRSRAGEGFMPSRINWVVQSSGVDYLHLLLVAMEYLTKRFEIDARYMISVHDEIRYLVKEEDKHRAAMALQVANLWTRSLFAYRLQMSDLPQSCAFFSAVDIDTCFRKEVFMECVTPSNPDKIAPGFSVDIEASLAATSHGSLFANGGSMSREVEKLPALPPLATALTEDEIRGDTHRVERTKFLIAQTSTSPSEIKRLWKEEQSDDERKPNVGARNLNSTGKARAGAGTTLAQAVRTTKKSSRGTPPKMVEDGWAQAVEQYVDASSAGARKRVATVRRSTEPRHADTRMMAQTLDQEVPDELEEEMSSFEPLARSTV